MEKDRIGSFWNSCMCSSVMIMVDDDVSVVVAVRDGDGCVDARLSVRCTSPSGSHRNLSN